MIDPAHGARGPTQTRSGCLTVAYVVLGLLLVTLVGLAVGAWLFVRSETGQRFVSTVREGAEMARDATTAPGTEALREAGCAQAMVMPFGRMMELLGQVVTVTPGQAPNAPGLVVFCQVDTADVERPGCEDLARVYGKAVPNAPERFGVVVQQSNGRRPACEGTYSGDGTYLGRLSSGPERQDAPGEPVAF